MIVERIAYIIHLKMFHEFVGFLRSCAIGQFSYSLLCNILLQVILNNVEYKPQIASPNKKEAKANAALVCLQSLGILPLTPQTVISVPPPTTIS